MAEGRFLAASWHLDTPPPHQGGFVCPPVGGGEETYPGRHIDRPLQNLHQHPGQRAGGATTLGKRWKPLQRASRMPALAQWPGGACHPSAALWVPAPFAQGSFWGWELRISASFSTRWNARRHRSFRPPSPVCAYKCARPVAGRLGVTYCASLMAACATI